MIYHSPKLLIVMPVFNEQSSIEKVVTEWFRELDTVVGDFVMYVIDDGSSDSTPSILKSLSETLDSRFETLSRANLGHGQTCMEGYRLAVARKIDFVFQIDSDGQCDPAYFRRFWELRDTYDVIYGRRTRKDGFHRQVASFVLRVSLLLRFKIYCVDANVPYRLMKTKVCSAVFSKIPTDLFLANVGLAVLLRQTSGIRHGSVPILFQERIGGEPSVPFTKFAAKALELFRQMKPIVRSNRV